MKKYGEQFLWVEKYRPTRIQDCILPKQNKEILQGYADNGFIPNLLMYGTQGVGKTSSAVALLNEIGFDYITINGANEGKLIDTLRTSIEGFASTISFKGKRKYVIIDEGDGLRPDIQDAFKGVIEKYSSNCGFIITCNNKYIFIPAFMSRFTEMEFRVNDEEKNEMVIQVIKRIADMLKKENIEYDKNVLIKHILKYFPDIRKIIEELQKYQYVGKIDDSILSNFTDENIKKLFVMLKNREFDNIREFVGKGNLDIPTFFKKMYEYGDKYLKRPTFAQMILDVEEYKYKSVFVADQEISIMAFLVNLMSNTSKEDYII